MTGAATRSRLIALRQQQSAARLGHELLDRKREAILRELLQRTGRRDRQRELVRREGEEAWRGVAGAVADIGVRAFNAAALAQPPSASVERQQTSVVGVVIPRLIARVSAFTPQYGFGGTSASLDAAGVSCTHVVADLVTLAEEEEAVRRLRSALRKTVRRLQALEKIVIPALNREASAVGAALEEEERDESFRRKRWVAAQ